MKKGNPDQQKPRRSRRWLIVAICLAIILICAAFALPYALSGAPGTAIIHIPANATQQNVSDSLKAKFGDDYATKVMRVIGTQKVGWDLRHGAYEITEGTSPIKAARKLIKGAQTPVNIIINANRGLPVVAQRISAKLDFTPDSLLNLLNDPSTLSKYDLTPDQALALFLDNTFQFYWSSSPQTVVDKIGENYLKVWTPERKQQAKELGLTPAEVMILASIVDSETNQADEKGTIGRLYINRLNKGMKLQSDPTVIFAIGDFSIRRVKGEHLATNSPYNTYRYKGLPPGPIKTTTVATIDSILQSKPNDYIYMCASEDFSGHHNFSVTYDVHMDNARRYRSALDQRGIN